MLMSQWYQRIDDIVQLDDYKIFPSGNRVRLGCLNDALRQYSRIRPRHLCNVFPAQGGGAFEYDLTTIVSGWNEDSFEVEKIIYPFGVYFAYQRNVIDEKFWQVYKKNDRHQWLMFFSTIPAAGLNIGLYYTTFHQLDETHDTISAERSSDFDAFCHLTASKILMAAANYYAAKGHSLLNADSIDYSNKSTNYAKRAGDEQKLALDFLQSEDRVTGVRLQWDTTFYGGADRIFKRRVWT